MFDCITDNKCINNFLMTLRLYGLYEIVFTDQIRVYRKVYERFKNNHENREKYIMEKENRSVKGKETGTHVILNGDPLSSKEVRVY